MLSASLKVNRRSILSDLNIARIKGEEGGLCRYLCWVLNSECWEVDHHYDDGAWELVRKAIESMPDKIKLRHRRK